MANSDSESGGYDGEREFNNNIIGDSGTGVGENEIGAAGGVVDDDGEVIAGVEWALGGRVVDDGVAEVEPAAREQEHAHKEVSERSDEDRSGWVVQYWGGS